MSGGRLQSVAVCRSMKVADSILGRSAEFRDSHSLTAKLGHSKDICIIMAAAGWLAGYPERQPPNDDPRYRPSTSIRWYSSPVCYSSSGREHLVLHRPPRWLAAHQYSMVSIRFASQRAAGSSSQDQSPHSTRRIEINFSETRSQTTIFDHISPRQATGSTEAGIRYKHRYFLEITVAATSLVTALLHVRSTANSPFIHKYY